ncbi:hypothetical protein SDC9_204952 [bioreactor metagenome]|uniref:Zn-dependent metallo-hydrolase RNA specificity domain-containing protein n=1 Tax=bioreactor metagenome TaxID=1076179 RepID=A0A645J0P2_9ZZZZ
MINWLDNFMGKPKEIFLVHGDIQAQNKFKELLDSKGYKSKIVDTGETYYINEKVSLKDSNIKYKIMKLLNSINNIESMNKDILMKQIEEVINNEDEKVAK